MAEMGTVQGALQSLQEMYQQRYDPEEGQRQMQARNQAVDQYQNLVDNPVQRPGFVDQLTNNYLSGYRPGFGTTSMLQSIGLTNNNMAAQQRDDRAAAMKDQLGVATLRQNMLKEEDAVLKNQSSMFGRAGFGKQPSPEQLRTVYNGALNTAAQTAKNLTFKSGEERMTWIKKEANDAVKNYVEQFATHPTGPRGTEAPSSEQKVTPEIDPLNVTLRFPEDSDVDVERVTKKLKANQEILRGNSSSEIKNASNKIINELVTMYGVPNPSLPPTQAGVNSTAAPDASPKGVVAGQQPPQTPFKNEVMEAQKPELGKNLAAEKKELDVAGANNGMLLTQLNLLENIYSNPNIPSGQLAGHIQDMRSALSSIGVKVAPEAGITDMARAISSQLALMQRTSSGTNLLPGSISNYETQLLEKMAPTINMTAEGRLALVQYMKLAASSVLRLQQEANDAAGESGLLPPDWYKRKQRVALEEGVKRRRAIDKIVEQYGGNQ